MYYAITVLSITSILLLVGVTLLMREIKTAHLECTRLQNQLAEQDPGDKFQTVRQKLDHARKHLIPKTRWKPGQTVDDVAYTEGMIYALDWLEHNHSKAVINMRHVRE